MGTHPIFESDFDCLTEMLRLTLRRSVRLNPSLLPTEAAAAVNGSLFSGIDRADMNVPQNTMLDIYGLMEDMTGYSSLAAIPLSIITVRALLYPAYIKMRIK